jgi:two-component system, cell cycle sensor histidine kinase and response regulator CckA
MSSLRGLLEEVAVLLPPGAPILYLRHLTGDRSLVWLSPAIEALTGHAAEQLLASPEGWASLVHADDRERVLSAYRLPPGDAPEEIEFRIVTTSGEIRWLQDRPRVTPVRSGTQLLAAGVLTDVTDRRTLEHQVSVMEERLWQSQRVESVGALAGGIAHDFNNLLTAILSSAQLITENRELPAEIRQDLMVIRTAAERGGSLVRQILGFSSRAARPPVLGDVGRSVLELEVILRRTLGEDITLEVSVADDLWAVHADPSRIEQVILNLAVNAREAMDHGGKLEIVVENVHLDASLESEGEPVREGEHVRLRVRDSGRGISPEIRSRIFDPYFSTKDKPEGGLGLATVRRIIRGYGGAIHLDSVPGNGSTFDVYLPAGRGGSRPLHESVAASTAAVPEGGLRVLVVEDDPRVRALMERTLQRLGHQAVTAGTAAEAVRIFDRVRPPFDLLLTDVVLPDRPGPELYGALARRVPGLPVILMSGYSEAALERKGAGLEGAEFLPKPFSPDQLKIVIYRAMASSRAAAPPAEDRLQEPGSG